jgi:adenine-specific DNA methylase
MNISKIPARTAIESDPPVLFASRLALREGNAKKPIYQIHKWWARRLGSVFRSILIAATTPAEKAKDLENGFFYQRHDLSGLVVLDPFAGGGTSLVEASKCNASVIGMDIDPVACFISAKELSSYNENTLLASFHAVEREVRKKLVHWYRTRLSDGREGTAVYMFWVDFISCGECNVSTAAHPHYQLNRNRRASQQVVFCSSCGELSHLPLKQEILHCNACGKHTKIKAGPVHRGIFTCPSCKIQTSIRKHIQSYGPLTQKLFALEVLIDDSEERVFKKATPDDLALFDRADAAWRRRRKSDQFVPTESIPIIDRSDPRPICFGYQKYRDLFNSRQLLCLSFLAEAITNVEDTSSRELLALAFSDCLAANNMFCSYAFDYQKLTPLFGLHAYNKVSRPVENNVWGTDAGRGSFIKCFNKMLRGKLYGQKPFEFRYTSSKKEAERVYTGESIKTTVYHENSTAITSEPFALVLNQSSEHLDKTPPQSVDLILTDPPYYNNLAYSELSDFYHVWLKRLNLKTYCGNDQNQTPLSESLYVNRNSPQFNKDHERFVTGLTNIFTAGHSVLRDKGLMVFTFHHNEANAWAAIATSILKSNFQITNVFPVRSEGQGQFHSAERNLKWDVVFCCRKLKGQRVLAVGGNNEQIRSKLWLKAKEQALVWKALLDKEGFVFSNADITSLERGFLVMYLSQEETTADLTGFFVEKGKTYAKASG